MILSARDVQYRYPGTGADALHDVSLDVAEGEVHAVLGPNGSGKTTLARVALGVVGAHAGGVELLGRPIAAWSRGEMARVVGVVAQREDNPFAQRVRDAVRLGRYPHLSPWAAERAADRAEVTRALERCDVASLSDRWMSTLSGGEYQRVRLARALAQEPRLLVLDEPSASLDVRHEMELFELIRSLADRQRLGVLLITHHVNLAARFADQLLLLGGGRVAAQGAPSTVLTRDVVDAVFGWPVTIESFEGRPQIIPLRQKEDTA